MIIRNGKFVETGPNDFGPDILSNDANDFIRRMKRRNQPFFMYYAEHLTHAPHTSMRDPEDPDGETKPGMESNVQCVDRMVGRLTDTLHTLGLWENTVLMVASDNPLPGKGAASAIGARVPLVVSGGSRWIRWNGPTDCLTDFADIYPTCMELAGVDPASRPDLCGRSWKPLLDGDRSHTRPWIFSYVGGIHRMIRDRDWCIDGLGQLYRCNDSADPFTYQRITKENMDSQARDARKALETILVNLPAIPEDMAAKNALASKSLELNRAGQLDKRQKNAERCYEAGIQQMMDSKARKIGPTRTQIERRKM
jgi:arylsulfatase A-like enzyme